MPGPSQGMRLRQFSGGHVPCEPALQASMVSSVPFWNEGSNTVSGNLLGTSSARVLSLNPLVSSVQMFGPVDIHVKPS